MEAPIKLLDFVFIKFRGCPHPIFPQVVILPQALLCLEGAVIDTSARKSLCDALLGSDVANESAAELACASTPCHVVIREGLDSPEGATEDEEELLGRTWGLDATSRVSCRMILDTKDLFVEVPTRFTSHASE